MNNGASAANPDWRHCQTGYNQQLYQDPTFGLVNPPGTYQGLAGTYQWLDAQGQPVTFGKIGAHGGPTFLQEFDDWCRGKDTQGGKAYATFPVTYTFDANKPITAVRFSVEKAGRGIWGSSLADTNLQSFWVVVEKQGQ